MGSFRVLVESQRAHPIAAEFLRVASSAIRLRALRFSPLLPITIAPHHHENVRFRAARHLGYVRFGSIATGRSDQVVRPCPEWSRSGPWLRWTRFQSHNRSCSALRATVLARASRLCCFPSCPPRHLGRRPHTRPCARG